MRDARVNLIVKKGGYQTATTDGGDSKISRRTSIPIVYYQFGKYE